MWQLRRSGTIVMAGLLGMGLVAGTRGARADDPSLLPCCFALHGLTSAGLPPFHRSDTLSGDLSDPLAPKDRAADDSWASLRHPWAEALFNDGCLHDSVPPVFDARPLPCLGDLPAALAEIRAAAAGGWSWEGGNPVPDALPCPETRPGAEPAQPLLPIVPPAPDLRALLASVSTWELFPREVRLVSRPAAAVWRVFPRGNFLLARRSAGLKELPRAAPRGAPSSGPTPG